MRKPGVQHRISVALVAALIAITGVSMGWSAPPVRAQDEVSAAAITPGMNAMVEDGPLNHRQQPTISAPVLQVLATGTLVSVISGPTSANGYNWWLVTANGTNGYVAGQYLAEAELPIGSSVYVNSNNVNIRSGPGTTYAITDQLSIGATAQVIGGPSPGNGYIWYRIQQYGTSSSGWIVGKYLHLAIPYGEHVTVNYNNAPIFSSPSGPITGHLSKGTTAQVIGGPSFQVGDTYYQIQYGSSSTAWILVAYLTPSNVPPVGGFGVGSWIMLDDPPVNVRSGPGTGYGIFGTLTDNSQPVQVTGAATVSGAYVWYPIITLDGLTGYVDGEYFEGGIYLNDDAIVADGPLNLRSKPGRGGSTVLTLMPMNASIFINNVTPVFNYGGIAWFNVTYNGTTGWAAGLFLGDA